MQQRRAFAIVSYHVHLSPLVVKPEESAHNEQPLGQCTEGTNVTSSVL